MFVIRPTTVVSLANLMTELVLATQSWVNRGCSRGLRTHPWVVIVLRVSVGEVLLPILTACGLPIRKSRIQLQRVMSRPRALSLEGTIVLNAEL